MEKNREEKKGTAGLGGVIDKHLWSLAHYDQANTTYNLEKSSSWNINSSNLLSSRGREKSIA